MFIIISLWVELRQEDEKSNNNFREERPKLILSESGVSLVANVDTANFLKISSFRTKLKFKICILSL
jgi:hypothetical protein